LTSLAKLNFIFCSSLIYLARTIFNYYRITSISFSYYRYYIIILSLKFFDSVVFYNLFTFYIYKSKFIFYNSSSLIYNNVLCSVSSILSYVSNSYKSNSYYTSSISSSPFTFIYLHPIPLSLITSTSFFLFNGFFLLISGNFINSWFSFFSYFFSYSTDFLSNLFGSFSVLNFLVSDINFSFTIRSRNNSSFVIRTNFLPEVCKGYFVAIILYF